MFSRLRLIFVSSKQQIAVLANQRYRRTGLKQGKGLKDEGYDIVTKDLEILIAGSDSLFETLLFSILPTLYLVTWVLKIRTQNLSSQLHRLLHSTVPAISKSDTRGLAQPSASYS